VTQPALLALMALRRSAVDVAAMPEPLKRTAFRTMTVLEEWFPSPSAHEAMLRAALDLNLLEEQIGEECATLYDQAPQIALPLYRVRHRSIAIDTGEIPFFGRSSSGGFWSRKIEYARSFNGD